ncbi:MAG TPA: thioredoxin [Saprospiraceae bacterium]|nr:thioredoxin [Saprospiraceae bacterium]
MEYNFGFINTLEEFDSILRDNDAVFVYFNSSSCNVGEALAPKVMKLIDTKFPKMQFYYVDRELSPEIAAKYSVFVEPTILTFFGGKETLRKSRHFSMDELESAMSRPYSILFE